MRVPLLALALLAACPLLARAGAAQVDAAKAGAARANRASAITAAGRSMDQALAGTLAGLGTQAAPQRSVMLLLDVTPSLIQAGFGDALERCIATHAERLAKVELGLWVVGETSPVLPLGADGPALLRAVRAALKKPTAQIKNLYAATRDLLRAFPGRSQPREILLVSLENGDAEDEVESTARALAHSKVVLRLIGSEAYLSDSYWVYRGGNQAPRGTELRGGDGAFCALPFGWMFQQVVGNEVAPATTPVWGLARMVAASGGRAHIYAPPPSTGHRCAIYGGCLFCNNSEHDPEVDSYWKTRVELFTASTASREEVYAAAATDPYYRIVLDAWQKASKARLIGSQPLVRLAGARLQEQRARRARGFGLSGTQFKRFSRDAKKAAYSAAAILSGMRAKLARVPKGEGIPRYEAMAHHTALMLQVTRINMLQLHFFCEEIAPQWVARRPPEYSPPEQDPVRQRERRPRGLAYTTFCLCHGAAPFKEIELPGGLATAKEFEQLQEMMDGYLEKFGHTPFGFSLRKAGIARFHLTYPGVVGKRPRRRPRSGEDEGPKTPTTPRRPSRAGGSSGGTGGPTTGR